jgi:integrase
VAHKTTPKAVFNALARIGDMKHLPFSVFKRSGRRFFSVKFKNEVTGDYLPAISTKQETESAAMATAFQWLKDGVPRHGEAVPLKKYTLRDMAKEADITPEDAEYICGELRRRGLLKTFILSESREAVPFADFLLTFWDFDNSPYIREKLRKNHGIHRYYCKAQLGTAKAYWVPFFPGHLLGDITKRDIESFIDSLDGGGKKLSAERKNHIIKAGTIALRWAYSKEMIGRDVTQGITWFSGKAAERQILTPELAAVVFNAQWADERTRLANMLAAVTGLRAGEIQGLRVQDLGKDCLYVRHSWNCRDGLKPPKNNESRTVEVFPELIRQLISLARENPHGPNMDGFIFWGERKAGKPIEERLLIRDLRSALIKTGMGRESAKVYTFHGWRHFYTSYLMGKLERKLLKSQTGHLTDAMLAHYGEHRIAGDRERIQAAQKEVFGVLIPSGAIA